IMSCSAWQVLFMTVPLLTSYPSYPTVFLFISPHPPPRPTLFPYTTLFRSEFWTKVINLEALAEAGTIAPTDPDLFTVVDDGEEGWEIVRKFYDLPQMGEPVSKAD